MKYFHAFIAFSNSAIKPSVVCFFASSAGSSFRARMVFARFRADGGDFICGNFFSSFGKSNRA